MKSLCTNCSAVFECENSATCWCADLPCIMPTDSDSCLCPSCLDHEINTKMTNLARDKEAKVNVKDLESSPFPMIGKEVDYTYNEDGLLVFSKSYHLRRGYCCKNDCLNCPYP